MSVQRPFIRRSAAVVGTLFALASVLLCATHSSGTELPITLVPATVEVPSSLRTTPFDQDRVLMVPPGFKISVAQRSVADLLGRPVDVKPANDGSLLISDDASGTIYRLTPLGSK